MCYIFLIFQILLGVNICSSQYQVTAIMMKENRALYGILWDNKAQLPSWASIDTRPVPSWFDEIKFGIFCHWGVYSAPAYDFGSDAAFFWWNWKGNKDPRVEQFIEKHYRSGINYGDFANYFTAEDFDADNFAEIVKASGAKYFVITSKHHEGYTLWPSKTSWNWNAVDIGPHRDLVAELKNAMRQKGLHFGMYISLFEWFNPLYLNDAKNNKTDYVQTVSYPQLLEIVNEYQPDLIWSDGDWERTDEYWRSKEFLAWLYNESPIKDKVAVNDRWGKDCCGKHGGYFTYGDHYDPGYLQPRKWENCLTLDRTSWGYRRDLKNKDVLSLKEVIAQLARTISCGGNMLLNIGPDSHGRIVPIFEERLRQMGDFVRANDEAIFGTKPWIHQNDTNQIWYTSRLRKQKNLNPARLYNPQEMKNTIVYAFLLDIPVNGSIEMPSLRITEKTKVTLLGASVKVPYRRSGETLKVDLSQIPWQNWPSTAALVLKIEYLVSSKFNPMESIMRKKMVFSEEMTRNFIDDIESSEELII